MACYYNEIDPYCAQRLRNLISQNLIAPGDVDERDIRDVQPDDVRGYSQCHFFAGIGGWSYALRLAGWPDDEPVWTGSCPCQPFSVASVEGEGAKGHDDERDLWPSLYRLIGERRPGIIFGEQVTGAIPWGWWDRTALGLEDAAYACAASVLRANAYGAAHERPRLYWLANALREGRQGHQRRRSLSCCEEQTFPIHGDPFTDGRRILEGDYSGLLLGDGISVAVERCAAKAYGNAIVPQVAAEFIRAAIEAIE